MPKKVPMSDILPSEHHRSIQDISMADVGRDDSEDKKTKKRKSTKKIDISDLEENVAHANFHPEYITHSHKPRWGMVGMWFVGIIAFIGLFIFASSFLHSAKIDIKIKEVSADVDTDVTLQRKDNSGVLPFEIVSLSKELSEVVPAKGEKQVSEKAAGRVVIYNKNTTAQKLLSQTRLESPSGKVYRLSKTLTVPGAKKSVPGSIESSVVADAPGSDYNSDLVDLTFPGFKDTSKYQTVYAMSRTPFTGGALGTIKVADDNDLAIASEKIKGDLSKQLLNSIDQQLPNSFILLPNIYVINYSTSTQETNGDILNLKQKSDIVGVLVDSKKLSSYLAKSAIPGYSGEDIDVNNIKDLSFSFATGTSPLNINTNTVSLKITGKPHFVYGYSPDQLKADLAGISRESFATVIATYPGIEKGNSKIEPFWRSKFPTDLGKITINEER